MKTLILYQTSTGATKKYATWIHEKYPESKLFTYEELDSTQIKNYERIIFCMPTYSGQITPREYLENNWEEIKDKKVYLLVVGMVPEEYKWSVKSYEKIKEDVREGLSGYMKVPGVNPDAGKKVSKIQKFFSKLFLGVDPGEISEQQVVEPQNLDPFYKILES